VADLPEKMAGLERNRCPISPKYAPEKLELMPYMMPVYKWWYSSHYAFEEGSSYNQVAGEVIAHQAVDG